MNKSSGFTLIELVTSLAITTVLILTLASLWSLSATGIGDIKTSSAIDQSVQDVRLTLGTPNGCTLNLASTPLVATPAGGSSASSNLPAIRNFDPSTGRPLNNLITAGGSENGYRVVDIRLKAISQIDISFLVAQLLIRYKKTDGFGLTTQSRSIGILAQVQGGKVQKCWLKKDVKTIAENQVCKTLSNGALNEFDPTVGVCGATNGHWFSDAGPLSARCPAGTQMSAQANAVFSCRIVPPLGFKDPGPLSEVTLTDGTTSPIGALNYPPYMTDLDSATQTCKCIYDASIPPGTLNQFKCQALCVVL